MSFETFLKKHPLFHRQELVEYLQEQGNYNQNTLKAALQYHLAQKHIARIRRSYYVVTDELLPGSVIESDPILIAGNMTKDAVISYHSAMAFHAFAYSIMSVTYFNSIERIGSINRKFGQFKQIIHPIALKPNDIFLETKKYDRMGLDIRVTSVERTLVDSLNRPNLSGGWEEIWRSFESVNFLDLERLINYALRLNNSTTIAKLGFFLEQHKDQFSVNELELSKLTHHRPKTRHYMDRKYKGSVSNLSRWNLIVPDILISKTWEEPHNDFV